MHIEGIGFSGYRSFGEALQLIGPFSKINLFVGQNNSGKSNILLFIKQIMPIAFMSMMGKGGQPKIEQLDRSLHQTSGIFRCAVGVRPDGSQLRGLVEKIGSQSQKRASEILDRLFHSPILNRGTELGWFVYEAPWNQNLEIQKELVKELHKFRSLLIEIGTSFGMPLPEQREGRSSSTGFLRLYVLSPLERSTPRQLSSSLRFVNLEILVAQLKMIIVG